MIPNAKQQQTVYLSLPSQHANGGEFNLNRNLLNWVTHDDRPCK